MRYTRFRITNYKGIRNTTLDLVKSPKGRIYPIVGLNESGKTTLLEAIGSFNYGAEVLGPRVLRDQTEQDVHDLIPASQRANFNDRISLSVTVELDDSDRNELRNILRKELNFKLTHVDEAITITEAQIFKNSVFQSSSNIVGGKFRGRGPTDTKTRELGAKDNEWQRAVAVIFNRLPRIWHFPDFSFDIPDQIFLDSHQLDSEAQKFYYQLLQDILMALKNGTNVTDHLLKRAQSASPSEKQSLSKLLLDIGRDLTTRVFGQWNAIFKREIEAKVRVSHERHPQNNRWFLKVQIEDQDGIFDLRERALGFRWFFVYLLLTSYRSMRTGMSQSVLFLFDEPASNLHSSAQQRLLESFKSLANSTIIYTTHSHHLIDPSWLETTFVARNGALDGGMDAESQTTRSADIQVQRYRSFVGEHPNQTTYFQPILDMLDYIPSSLESVPQIVMVEGKNDYFTLSYFQELACDKNDDRIRLLPGGGAGSLDAPIRLYLGWGRNFIVLLDSDDEGQRQKQRYFERFGSLVEGRLFTLLDFDNSWKNASLEDLILESDRLAILRKSFPDQLHYKKDLFYRSVQELFHTNAEISVSKESSTNLRNLLLGLSIRLKQADTRL